MTTKSQSKKCAVKVLEAVPPTMWFIRCHMRRHREGLSLPQFRALYFIHANPSVALSRVAGHLGASVPSTSRLIADLESQRLVARRSNAKDRRVIELAVTSKGAAVTVSARSATIDRITEALAAFSDREQAAIAKAMDLLQRQFLPTGCTPDGAQANN
jgi:DNA-binding MarR family transcriptional regulator